MDLSFTAEGAESAEFVVGARSAITAAVSGAPDEHGRVWTCTDVCTRACARQSRTEEPALGQGDPAGAS